MISKIDYIRNFGIYKNFKWSSNELIDDFNDKNIIYGWNYSGKTTLSRIFSTLRDKALLKDYLDADFKVITNNGHFDKSNISSFPFKVLVFNSDYIKDNLRWDYDEDINAIYFEVGENAKHTKRIEELESAISEIVGSDKIIGKRSIYQQAVDDFNAFEDTLFSVEAKKIKDEHFISLINFTKSDIRKIKEQVKDSFDANIIKRKKELIKTSKIIKIEQPKEQITYVEFEINLKKITDTTNEILTSSPSKQHAIEVLDSNMEAYNWVKDGLNFNTKNANCLFCNNNVSEERFNLLKKYFENQAAKVKLRGNELFEQINLEENAIDTINFPNSVNDLNEGFQDEYELLRKQFTNSVKKYKSFLKQTKSKITKKLSVNLYTQLDKIYHFDTENLLLQLDKLNELIRKNNDFSKNFSEILSSERDKYIKHLVSVFLKSNKYLLKEKKSKIAKVKLDQYDAKIEEYRKEIARLKALRLSDTEGCAQFNSFVQSFLGRDDIEIKQSKSTKKFSLKRGLELAKNLSEGEKMAISFSHFLVNIRSIEQKNELKECIIFIDDPISSLDGNHIFQINSLLKDMFFGQIPDPNQPKQLSWQLKCKQIFFSIHNFEFFNLLKEMPVSKNGFKYSSKAAKSKESRYFISRNVNDSQIVKLPEVYNSYSSEYHYLFSEILSFNNSPNQSIYPKLLLLPNILRRFLEMYTLTQYPSSDELDVRSDIVFGKIFSKRICKPFHYFSHFNNIDRIGKQSELIADISSACRSLIQHFEDKEDKRHYTALKKAVSI